MAEKEAVRLQIQELQYTQDFLLAQRILFDMDPSEPADDEEAVVATMLNGLILLEQSMLLIEDDCLCRASIEAANVLEMDEKVAQHDSEFARALMGINKDDWKEFGLLVDDPYRPSPDLHRNASIHSSLSVPKISTSDSNWKEVGRVDRDMVKCLICFDDVPKSEAVCGERSSDEPSCSKNSSECGHFSCLSCAKMYIIGLIEKRSLPIVCFHQGCKRIIPTRTVDLLLQDEDSARHYNAFCRMEAESAIPIGLRSYCPYKDCSIFLETDPDASEPSLCPGCGRGFCSRCKVIGWHTGFTCTAFQALPGHLQSSEDAEFLNAMASNNWMKCPDCSMAVERTVGCNHMKCRCGHDFCYSCGGSYKSNQSSALNVHGTPSCKCLLFSVPDENPRRVVAAVVAEANAQRLRRLAQGLALPGIHLPAQLGRRPAAPALVRGGKRVREIRCWHSDSIYDCPNRERCWFRHDEDE